MEGDLGSQLREFTGTEHWYRHWTRAFAYTDGVKYLADKTGAYWLIDVIASHQPKVRKIPFQVWNLTTQDAKGHVTMREDEDQPAIVKQEIEYTDFPLKHIDLYLSEKVLMLPGEY